MRYIGELAYRINATYLVIPVVEQVRMRSRWIVSWLGSVLWSSYQYFDTVSWVTFYNTLPVKALVPFTAKYFLLDHRKKWRKKTRESGTGIR